jgi:hypothetical protein
MPKKNLKLKTSLKPVTTEELDRASGGGRVTRYGCCVANGETHAEQPLFRGGGTICDGYCNN